MAKDKRVKISDVYDADVIKRIKGRTGHSPAILGKGHVHPVRTKYRRKPKHRKVEDDTNV